MASTLSNMRFYAPISSKRINKFSSFEFSPLSGTKNRALCNNVKAKALSRELSLQRAKQQQQLQPKMGPQAPPTVLLKIMEDPLVYSSDSPLIVGRDGDEYSQGKLPWAIKEGEKDYKMRFNIPGMNKNDVKVWIEKEMLVVKAEKVPRKLHEGHVNGNEEGSTEIEEWPAKSYGRYSHRIALPENTEFEKIKAHVKDGVLYITIPKTNTCGQVIAIDVQ